LVGVGWGSGRWDAAWGSGGGVRMPRVVGCAWGWGGEVPRGAWVVGWCVGLEMLGWRVVRGAWCGGGVGLGELGGG
jgi:hypothetical protein